MTSLTLTCFRSRQLQIELSRYDSLALMSPQGPQGLCHQTVSRNEYPVCWRFRGNERAGGDGACTRLKKSRWVIWTPLGAHVTRISAFDRILKVRVSGTSESRFAPRYTQWLSFDPAAFIQSARRIAASWLETLMPGGPWAQQSVTFLDCDKHHRYLNQEKRE